ncbi:hypothetical protein ABFV83_12365 [Lacrimispora sp. BS-2]|uniref:Uncharacterized protein n=1 Tax=Lacrimispora sp. BS-2 TaxID=3151850 RepID=A0AAU7PKI4_9FIRM
MDVEKDCPNTFTDTVMNFFAKKDQKESSDVPLRVVGICTPKIISAEWDNGGNTVEVNKSPYLQAQRFIVYMVEK